MTTTKKSTADKSVKLTAREREILQMKAEGMTSQAMADRLFVAKRTIDFHLANVYRKLEVSNALSAVSKAIRLGVLPVAAVLLLMALIAPATSARVLRHCKLSHYCGKCDDSHKTATGRRWRGRGVAVDPSVIPLGSKVWIAGYGDRFFIADDTGSRVSGRHVDVRHQNQSDNCTCNKKGVQVRRVVFVRPGTSKGGRRGN